MLSQLWFYFESDQAEVRGFTLACVHQTSAEQAEDICSNTGDGLNYDPVCFVGRINALCIFESLKCS